MKRVQIYLPEFQVDKLKLIAFQEKVNFLEIIRKCIDDELNSYNEMQHEIININEYIRKQNRILKKYGYSELPYLPLTPILYNKSPS